jgi:hypothetical protein
MHSDQQSYREALPQVGDTRRDGLFDPWRFF